MGRKEGEGESTDRGVSRTVDKEVSGWSATEVSCWLLAPVSGQCFAEGAERAGLVGVGGTGREG